LKIIFERCLDETIGELKEGFKNGESDVINWF
jgi:hypothetical protein